MWSFFQQRDKCLVRRNNEQKKKKRNSNATTSDCQGAAFSGRRAVIQSLFNACAISQTPPKYKQYPTLSVGVESYCVGLFTRVDVISEAAGLMK